MPLPRNRLLASVPNTAQPTTDAVLTDAPQPAPAPQKIYTRADRPPSHPDIPTSNNDLKKWVRDQLDAIKKSGKQPAQSTLDDYRRKYKTLDAARDETGIIPVHALGENDKTHYAKRAAIGSMAAERARKALAEISRADGIYSEAKKASDVTLATTAQSDMHKAFIDLIYAANDLAQYPPKAAGKANTTRINTFQADKTTYDKHPDLQGIVYENPTPPPPGSWKAAVQTGSVTPSTKPSTGKRRDMARIQKTHSNWRDLAYDRIAPKWQTFFAVASVAGCRPEEIRSITWKRDSDDPTFLTFIIKGAKTNQGHGIETRVFTIRENSSKAYDHLHQLAKDGPQSAPIPTMKGSKPLKDIKSAFRNAVNEAGRTFIRQRADCPTLSPYCLRHSFACDLKADGYTTEELAIALGHSTTKTQRMYGRAGNGIKGKREMKVDTNGYNIKVIEPTASPLLRKPTDAVPPSLDSGSSGFDL